MGLSNDIKEIFGYSNKSDDFIVGTDVFSDLVINTTSDNQNFYYFYNKKDKRLIKQFLLENRPQVDYVCQVTLVKKDNKFSPRLTFLVRDTN